MPAIATIDNAAVERRLPGCLYLDVRTQEEFGLGHVAGAYNLPFQLGSLSGLRDNPVFERVAQAALPVDVPLIVGCHSGGRARAAAQRLFELGFRALAIHLEGWDGHRDAFGRRLPGWKYTSLPTEVTPRPGRSYAELSARAQGSADAAR